MGTKNNPAKYDCYANAELDEPMFILLGRDRNAPSTVEAWANAREIAGDDPAMIQEARNCAIAMRAWLAQAGKTEAPILTQFEAVKVERDGLRKTMEALISALEPSVNYTGVQVWWSIEDRQNVRGIIKTARMFLSGELPAKSQADSGSGE